MDSLLKQQSIFDLKSKTILAKCKMPLNQTSMEFYISRKMFDSMINKKCLHFFFKQIKKKKFFFYIVNEKLVFMPMR